MRTAGNGSEDAELNKIVEDWRLGNMDLLQVPVAFLVSMMNVERPIRAERSRGILDDDDESRAADVLFPAVDDVERGKEIGDGYSAARGP
jgi:hypothetical protein